MKPTATDPRPDSDETMSDIQQQIRDVIEHFEHVLPGQAPIKDFVHHNTLHGYQHLTFPQALKAARETTGASAYQPESVFRGYFQQGRINQHDLELTLSEDESLETETLITDKTQTPLLYKDIYLCSLVKPLKPLTGCQLNWHIEELDALYRFQDDVSSANREQLLKHADENDEASAINALWAACLKSLRLEHYIFHPEELVDLDPERAEEILQDHNEESETTPAWHPSELHKQVHRAARNQLGQLIR